MKTKTVMVDENVHRSFKAEVAIREGTLQNSASTALRYWFSLLDTARTAMMTGETMELANLVYEIDDA